jgi:hypothetical protein
LRRRSRRSNGGTRTGFDRLDADGHPDLVAPDRDGHDRQVLGAAVEPLAGAHIVSAAMPGASQLGSLYRPEVQGKRRIAAPVRHGMELSVDVHDQDGLSLDVDRGHLAGRNVADGARAPVHRPLGRSKASDLDQDRTRRRTLAKHDLLKAEQARPERLFHVVAHCLQGDTAVLESVQPHVDGAADHLGELDVDAVIVEVTTHRIERLFRQQPAVHGQQLV